MAVKARDDRTSGGKDEAYRHSGTSTKAVRNDQYEGRVSDADLADDDGLPLDEREEWNLTKVARRGKWQDQDNGE